MYAKNFISKYRKKLHNLPEIYLLNVLARTKTARRWNIRGTDNKREFWDILRYANKNKPGCRGY
jgi:hypothetical protein